IFMRKGFAFAIAASLLALACGSKPTAATLGAASGSAAQATTGTPPPPVRRGGLESDAGVDLPPLKPLEVTENDFVESDRNRDPFRSFASSFVAQANTPAAANQRTVLLNE